METERIIAYFLCMLLVLASRSGVVLPCALQDDELCEVSEAETELITEPETTEPTETEPETAGETEPEPTEAETVGETEEYVEEVTEPETEPISYVVGTSSAGYPIEQVDGITYVGGVLIANKSYSLPSWYNVGGLTPETEAAFSELRSAAELEGLSIYCISGFRSYQTQNSVYWNYVSADGAELADTYSARPGHSEHQTGLALDVNSLYTSFGDTAEGKWLAEHCHEYGFIIRYPADKVDITGYMYEPWHIRYVGKYIAGQIKAQGICLEEYLGITSCYE